MGVRYFAEISFLGTNFVGWQRQPNGLSVQEVVEDTLSTILREAVPVVGCGRTDAGVHAQKFVLHFDTDQHHNEQWLYKFNRVSGPDIAFRQVWEVGDDMHARFSAKSRSYKYYLSLVKDPLHQQISTRHIATSDLDFEMMNKAGELLRNYNEFKPFCKSGSDTPHYLCDMTEAEWTFDKVSATFTISANRFLRGMVRLIVGTMLQIGNNKLSLDEFTQIMETQSPLLKPESVAAQGLHLVDVVY